MEKSEYLAQEFNAHRRGTKIFEKRKIEIQKYRALRADRSFDLLLPTPKKSLSEWEWLSREKQRKDRKARGALARIEDRLKKILNFDHVVIRKGIETSIESLNYGEGCYKGAFRSYKVSDKRSTLVLAIKDIKKISLISGVITLKHGAKKVSWFEPSRGKTYKKVEGFLIFGKHIAETDQTKAIKKALKLKKLELLAEKRAYILSKDLKKAWCDKEASLKAGNCLAGTENFIKKAGLENVGAIRADYLLELAQRYGVLKNAQLAITQAHVKL